MLFLNVFLRRWAAGPCARQCFVGEFRSASCFSLWRSIFRVYSCFWSLPKPISNRNTVSFYWLCLLALSWNNAFFPCFLPYWNSPFEWYRNGEFLCWWNYTLRTLSCYCYWRAFCMFWNIIFNYVSFFLTIHNFIIPLLWRLRVISLDVGIFLFLFRILQ